MARRLRIHYPGALYHVMLRGNAGEQLFFSTADHERFQGYLRDGVERFGCRIHAFCSMTNHIHLALQVGTVPLSQIMQSLVQRYTQWINLSRGRTGHLFQGRYKAILVDGDTYLLGLVRYIHLNPVRAGMVSSNDVFPWSSHRCYLGVETLPWLTTDWVLSLFSPQLEVARAKYRDFHSQSVGDEGQDGFLSGTYEGRILGDDAFADEALMRAEQRRDRTCTIEEILAAVCLRYRLMPSDLRLPGKFRSASEARALAAVVVKQAPQLSMTELGREVNRDISALSKAAQRLTRRARENPALAQYLQKFCEDLF